MWKRIAVVALIVWGAHSWWSGREVAHGAGVVADGSPRQSDPADTRAIDYHDYRLTPLADYTITARVLSREDYHLGREAELSKTDLALGWGRMSDSAVLKDIEISQSQRFYHWHVNEFPIPRREIETSSANVHLIAADGDVAKRIAAIRKGQVVTLRGQLVQADARDGWKWRSSLTRDDTGAGACELLFVESAELQ